MRDRFSSGVAEQLEFYVYLLIDPRDGQVFYVGKGTGERCFAHLEEARRMRADTSGDYEKLKQIRAIERDGRHVRIDVLRHGLTEQEAFMLESAAIDLLGRAALRVRVAGHNTESHGRMSVDGLNALYGAEPVDIDPSHRVVLIRLNKSFERLMSATALYEGTRGWWKVGAGARKLGSPTAPEWALAVSRGVVRAVYRIEGWEEPSQALIAGDPKREGRWGFFGEPDAAMEARYLNRDVSSYLRSLDGVPSQNPIRYVGCQRGSGQRHTTRSHPTPRASV
jgi:uncharacterized protein